MLEAPSRSAPRSVSRFAFLRGKSYPRAPLRPPWAISEVGFTDSCTRCGKCADACPEDIIIGPEGDLPSVDFALGECTFCGDCVTACRPRALEVREGRAPWAHRAKISNSCLSLSATPCRVCGDYCESLAISFKPAVGGLALAVLDDAKCTGCGACFAPCPVRAITIETPSGDHAT